MAVITHLSGRLSMLSRQKTQNSPGLAAILLKIRANREKAVLCHIIYTTVKIGGITPCIYGYTHIFKEYPVHMCRDIYIYIKMYPYL